jgi:prepilin-type N-terminal cleavage/methylation domain-containing protein
VSGFTLVEIILVLVIMGVIAGLGLPRIDYYKYRADANATMIRSLMMQAQRDAIVRQHDLIFSIDTARNRIILGYDQNNDGSIVMTERIRTQALPEQGKFAAPTKTITTGGDLTNYGPIRATSLRTISGYPSVIFRRDGSVSTALELYMTTKRAKNTDIRGVTVVQSTGRTDFYRYNGSTWKSAL